MLRNLKAALFDLDGTVLDRRGSLEAFGRSQWERFDRLQGVERDVYVQTLLLLDRHGQTPGRKLFTGLVAHFDLLTFC